MIIFPNDKVENYQIKNRNVDSLVDLSFPSACYMSSVLSNALKTPVQLPGLRAWGRRATSLIFNCNEGCCVYGVCCARPVLGLQSVTHAQSPYSVVSESQCVGMHGLLVLGGARLGET